MIDDLTQAERELYFYLQGRRTGSFTTKLFDAISVADFQNREKLRKAFPDEVAALDRLQNEPGFHNHLFDSMILR